MAENVGTETSAREHVETITHEIGADGEFGLRTVDSDARIHGVEGTVATVSIRYRVSGGSPETTASALAVARVRVDKGPGRLAISVPKRREEAGRFPGSFFPDGVDVETELELRVPRDASVSVTGASADVLVDGMRGRQSYQTVSGDVMLRDVEGSISVNAVSGDVLIRGGDLRGVSARSISGDVVVSAGRIAGMTATTVSGDVAVKGRLEGAGEYRVETVSGDLSLAPRGGVRVDVRGMSAGIRSALPYRTERTDGHPTIVVGNGGALVRFRSMSGSLEVGSDVRQGASAASDPDESAEARRATSAAAAPGTPAADSLETTDVSARGTSTPDPTDAVGSDRTDPREVDPSSPVEVDPFEPVEVVPIEPVQVGPSDEERLAVLRALGEGRIDVDEAARRLGEDSGG